MAGLDPAIHLFFADGKSWMPGTSPGMTKLCTGRTTMTAAEAVADDLR